jgi:hypothetical protein
MEDTYPCHLYFMDNLQTSANYYNQISILENESSLRGGGRDILEGE